MALRVVNRIETEVVHAAYELWLRDESGRCARVGALLDGRGAGRGGEGKGMGGDGKREEEGEVHKWVQRYCADCEESLGLIRETRGGRGVL